MNTILPARAQALAFERRSDWERAKDACGSVERKLRLWEEDEPVVARKYHPTEGSGVCQLAHKCRE